MVQLTVNDGQVDSQPDVVTINTVNSAPVANAGEAQTAAVGTTVILQGNRSSDVDGDPLTFRWTFLTRPTGSQATLLDPMAVNPTFVVDRPGTYVAQLIVNDGTLDSLPATVTITADDIRPVANAGADQPLVAVRQTVQLDGSGSSDADGDPLSFRWALTTRPAGSQATLTNSTLVNPTFVADVLGTYVAQLIVNDGTLDSAPDSVSISAFMPGSVADPVGDASPFPSVQVSPDLVAVTVGTDGMSLIVEVRFAPGTFNATTLTQVNLDTDQNPDTGSPGVDSEQNDSDLMGVEFIINIGGNRLVLGTGIFAPAVVLQFAGQPNSFTPVGNVQAEVLAQGYRVSVPLTLLNNVDGRINFKVTTFALLDPSVPSFTGILDYMPNLGLPPGVAAMKRLVDPTLQDEGSIGGTSCDECGIAYKQSYRGRGAGASRERVPSRATSTPASNPNK